MTEMKFVCVVLTCSSLTTGEQQTFRYYSSSTDHQQAAKEAFAALATGPRRVMDIETYDGPPRRWDPLHDVEERV